MCPGSTPVSSGSVSSSRAIESISVWWSEPGRSVRPTEPWKSTSPEKIAFSAGIDVRHVVDAVARRADHVDLEARELQLVAVRDRLLGRVGLERPEAREPHVVVDVLEDEDLALGAVDRRAGAAGHLGDRADVVEVAVGDQDRLDRRAELVERGRQRVRLVTRIDQQRLRRALLAGDPGVLLDRPDGQPTRLHRATSSARPGV